MHYTDHDDPYVHVDNTTTYDSEAEKRCNLLGDLTRDFWSVKCKKAKRSDGKFYPPYGLVNRINLQSAFLKSRLTGTPKRWKSWVSLLAQDFTHALKKRKVKLVKPKYIGRM
jgi:hypothetical protein